MARRIAYVLIWLALTAELEGFVFHGLWSTPLTTLGGAIFLGLPGLKVPLWDLVLIVTLFAATRSKPNRVPAVVSSIWLSFGAVFALLFWGVIRGGTAYQTIFQIRCFLLGLLVALLIASTHRTLAHVRTLGKVVLSAVLYRCAVLLVFYYTIARHLEEMPPALTDHCDSVLFVGGLLLVLINALERRTRSAILFACASAALICTAIVLNNRRLAWLLTGVGLAMIYLLLPKGKLKRTINRIGLGLAPVFVAYVVAGWGKSTGIFKPVGSISTMFGTHQDASSVMRDIENYNLLITLKSNPLLGVGFGYEYIEEVRAFDISQIFPQYRYLPHNSLLGAIAFTGVLGFTALWQVVAVAAYLHARVLKVATDPLPRIAALCSIAVMVIISLQMWGDIGFNHLMVNTMLAVTIGIAGRLPLLTGVWPGVTEAKQTAPVLVSDAGQDVQHGQRPAGAEYQ